MGDPEKPALDATVAEACERHGTRPDALIEILHELRAALGHVPRAAVPLLAEALNLSRADVHGVVSFYHDFENEPGGRRMIRICRAEACQAMGCEALVDHAERTLGVACGDTTADGALSLRAVYCLGNCALAPSVMIGERLHGRVDGARFDALVAGLRP